MATLMPTDSREIAKLIRQEFNGDAIRAALLATSKCDPSAKSVKLSDLWIRHKDPDIGITRLVPNQVQAAYLDDILPGWKEGDWKIASIRDLILKFRQPGFSTIIGAIIFLNVYNQSNVRALILAQDMPASETLFEMHRMFYEHLPEHKKRKLKKENVGELYFEDTNSRLYIGTAGRVNIGRGATIQYLHMSERAKWKIGIRKLRELDAGIKQAVPDRGNIWEETTANGMGHFYTEWCNARDGVSRYRPKFFSWKEHAEYELTKERYYQLMGDDWHADKVEIEIQKLHDLTDDKMRWRHIKKLELSDLFEQEYPLNDVEAFQSSVDSAYYPTEYLTKLYEELSKPESRPCKSFKVSDHFPGYTGTIEIYEYPHKDKRYVCGADIAEGIRSDKDHDFSTFDIFRNDTRQQVVSYWGQPDPVMFADILDWMCRQYNDALLAPEDNNHGLATIERLKTLRYPKLHYYTIQRLQDGRRIEHQKAGWHASSRTKPHRDDRLADSLREAAEGHDNIKLRCRRSVAELITYVKLPNGRAGGEGSSHDDKNTSIGIANLLFDDRRPERDKKHVPPEPVKKYG